ncbi:MAG: hypothetical protein V1904_07825 [Bacteroidota bacterium]
MKNVLFSLAVLFLISVLHSSQVNAQQTCAVSKYKYDEVNSCTPLKVQSNGMNVLNGVMFSQKSSSSKSQTATTTIVYTGAQALGCCNICGLDYWCINNTGGCGTSSVCDSKTFTDPIPAGNIATSITINYWSAGCSGSSITAYVNSNVFPTVNEANTGCLCSDTPCYISATTMDTSGAVLRGTRMN